MHKKIVRKKNCVSNRSEITSRRFICAWLTICYVACLIFNNTLTRNKTREFVHKKSRAKKIVSWPFAEGGYDQIPRKHANREDAPPIQTSSLIPQGPEIQWRHGPSRLSWRHSPSLSCCSPRGVPLPECTTNCVVMEMNHVLPWGYFTGRSLQNKTLTSVLYIYVYISNYGIQNLQLNIHKVFYSDSFHGLRTSMFVIVLVRIYVPKFLGFKNSKQKMHCFIICIVVFECLVLQSNIRFEIFSLSRFWTHIINHIFVGFYLLLCRLLLLFLRHTCGVSCLGCFKQQSVYLKYLVRHFFWDSYHNMSPRGFVLLVLSALFHFAFSAAQACVWPIPLRLDGYLSGRSFDGIGTIGIRRVGSTRHSVGLPPLPPQEVVPPGKL